MNIDDLNLDELRRVVKDQLQTIKRDAIENERLLRLLVKEQEKANHLAVRLKRVLMVDMYPNDKHRICVVIEIDMDQLHMCDDKQRFWCEITTQLIEQIKRQGDRIPT